MVTWKLPPVVATWVEQLSGPLHGRLAWRLVPVLTGLLFAQGRRTFACWLRVNIPPVVKSAEGPRGNWLSFWQRPEVRMRVVRGL